MKSKDWVHDLPRAASENFGIKTVGPQSLKEINKQNQAQSGKSQTTVDHWIRYSVVNGCTIFEGAGANGGEWKVIFGTPSNYTVVPSKREAFDIAQNYDPEEDK